MCVSVKELWSGALRPAFCVTFALGGSEQLINSAAADAGRDSINASSVKYYFVRTATGSARIISSKLDLSVSRPHESLDRRAARLYVCVTLFQNLRNLFGFLT